MKAPTMGSLFLYDGMVVEILGGVERVERVGNVVCFGEVTSAFPPVGGDIREADWPTLEAIPAPLAAAIRRAVAGAAPDWLAEVS